MRQSKKRVLAALMSGMMLTGMLAGCSGDSQKAAENTASAESTAASGKDRADMNIKVVLKTLASEYWQYVQTGCEAAGRDLGVNVEVLGATPETAYEEQIQIIETTLNAADTDAMVVAPLQADSVANQIANTDVPVVAIDTQVDSDKVLSFVGFDNEEMAALGGKAAAEAAKEAGWTEITAIGIAGVQGDSTSEARMKGYQQGIEEAGGTFLMDELQYANSTADRRSPAWKPSCRTIRRASLLSSPTTMIWRSRPSASSRATRPTRTPSSAAAAATRRPCRPS